MLWRAYIVNLLMTLNFILNDTSVLNGLTLYHFSKPAQCFCNLLFMLSPEYSLWYFFGVLQFDSCGYFFIMDSIAFVKNYYITFMSHIIPIFISEENLLYIKNCVYIP